MQTLNELKLEIIQIFNNNPVALFMSGGFDSTTLAHVIFQTLNNEGIEQEFTVYTVPRLDDSTKHAKRVLGWLSQKFPRVQYKHEYVGNPYLKSYQQVFSGVIAVLLNTDKFVILSDTNVPEELRDQWAPPRKQEFGDRVYLPFINYYKTHTVALAHELNALEEISKISHTCTESKEHRCNYCWQCKERAWAFKQLDLVDVGEM